MDEFGERFRTEKGNTRWVSGMESLSVLAEILGARHHPAHRFQRSMCTLWHLVPCPLEASDGCSAQC
jgi:hypothetical protein